MLAVVSLGLWDGPEIRRVLMDDAGSVNTTSGAYENGFIAGVVGTAGLGAAARSGGGTTASTGTVTRYMGPGEAAAARAGTAAVDANKLAHIFGKAQHNLGPLVQKIGSQEGAFTAVQSAAQAAEIGRAHV